MKSSNLLTISFILTVFSCFSTTHALKFLVYNPRFGKSHVMYMGSLADILVKGGHDVLNYQPVHNSEYNDTGVKLARTRVREADHPLDFNFTALGETTWKGMSFLTMFRMNIVDVMRLSCTKQLEDEPLLEELRKEKFDFGLTGYMDKCAFALFEKIGVKRFGIVSPSSLHSMFMSSYGIPTTESYVPEGTIAAMPPFSFVERLKNVLIRCMMQLIFMPKFHRGYLELGHKYVNKDFDLLKQMQEASVVFVNVDEFLDFPRPISQKFHYIGGIGMKKPEPLTKKYEEIFSKSGQFIYMSFGTVAPSIMMPNETKQAFLTAFSHFPNITFLWKYEQPEDNINANHPNVIVDKWWPQKDLLSHPKLLAFITHGGMNSVGEASHAGVPLITIPLFADQHRNAKMVEFRLFGIALDSLKLTEESITQAIKQITENKSYKQNAVEIKNVIAAKPYSSEDVFLKYSEFAAKFDLNTRLDLSGRHLNTIEFYNLDVIAFIITITLLFLYISFIILRIVFKRLLNCIRSEKTKNE